MKNSIKGKSFSLITIIILFVMLGVTAFIGYIFDPAMYYRIPNYKTYCTEQYTTAGLIKNHSAEVAIIGSSMMQNTNVDLVEELFDKEAIRYTLSGMTIDEIAMLVNRSLNVENNVDRFIINLDLSMFNSEEKSPFSRLPEYIYDDIKLNDIKYLLGYDTWVKFIPFNFIYNVACNIDSTITDKISVLFERATNIDLMGNWSNATNFSEEIVKNGYISGIAAVSEQNLDGMLTRMKSRFDNVIYPLVIENNNKEFNFIFPPYSILMWYNAEEEGYLEVILKFKEYIVEKFDGLENVKLYDFQDYEGILDLNNYKDTTHYKPEFNDMMIRCIVNNQSTINILNMKDRIINIKEKLELFKENEKDWLNNIK